MRAALCRTYGPPEVITVEDLPLPVPGAEQVRVRILAAAVNFPDALIVANEYQMSVPTPFVPGSEFAGVIDAVGDGVVTMGIGDTVAGTGLVGAFAEAIVVSAGSVRPFPASMEPELAAAAGVAHSTAYHVLRSVAAVQPGDELIVLGAGGGVGSAAVQLGVLLGARVTAVASSAEKLELAASFGAVNLIDHTEGDLRPALKATLPSGADVVVDPVGGPFAEPALRSLRWGGRFVTVGFAAGAIPKIALNLVLLKGVTIQGFQFQTFATNEPEAFLRNERELAELVASGRAVPHIGARFGLDDVASALALVANGDAIGKVVIVVR